MLISCCCPSFRGAKSGKCWWVCEGKKSSTGLEPAISRFVGGCLIHWATKTSTRLQPPTLHHMHTQPPRTHQTHHSHPHTFTHARKCTPHTTHQTNAANIHHIFTSPNTLMLYLLAPFYSHTHKHTLTHSHIHTQAHAHTPSSSRQDSSLGVVLTNSLFPPVLVATLENW